MHCASLGEFEQGRPVVEALRKEYPDLQIALSFFSPSGYEVQKKYKGADLVFYLPEDTPSHARKLIRLLKPSLVIMVKYEFWYHYLKAVKQANIELLLISGIFRPAQPFFRWYGTLHRRIPGFFTHLFVQNKASVLLLDSIGYSHVTLSGDTRFDRVLRLSGEPFSDILLEKWIAGRPVLVCGSTWPADEVLLAAASHSLPELAFLIVPHNTDDNSVADCRNRFAGSFLYTDLPAGNGAQVLILNTTGMLSKVYRHGMAAYVGGGQGTSGLHNVLEPAVYGVPVIHGPQYAKFQEATDLRKAGGSAIAGNETELIAQLQQWIQQPELRIRQGESAARFVKESTGATDLVMTYLRQKNIFGKRNE